MNAYEERINNKIVYAKARAETLTKKTDNFFNKSFEEKTGIPMGQPILVGHHSERKHRKALERYDNQIKQNIEDIEKAQYYKEKAERLKDNLENNKIISSDDPEAIRKLQDKISKIETVLKRKKEVNQKLRAYKTLSNAEMEINKLPENNPDKKLLMGAISQKKYYALPPERINAYYFSTTDSTAEIKRLNDRIKHLRNIQAIPEERTEKTINGVLMKIDKEANRLKLFFDGKPEQGIRAKLKSNGFRWSPTGGCWQSYLKKIYIQRAEEILKEMVV